MAVSVFDDIKNEKISNLIIMSGMLGIVFKLCITFSPAVLLDSLAGLLIPVASLFLLFYLHMFGAGDIKLLAVTGGFFGIRGSLFCMAAALFAAAFMSLIKMMKYHLFHERFSYFFHYMKKIYKTHKRIPYYKKEALSCKSRIHFSIPIAIGAVAYIGGGMRI